MKIYEEKELKDFEFWGGAKDFRQLLTYDELDIIELALEDLYPKGIKDIALNDIFWFDDDFIAEILGTTVDDIYNRGKI